MGRKRKEQSPEEREQLIQTLTTQLNQTQNKAERKRLSTQIGYWKNYEAKCQYKAERYIKQKLQNNGPSFAEEHNNRNQVILALQQQLENNTHPDQ
jgi:hypothetical protein